VSCSGSLVRRRVLTFIVNVRALEFAQHELVMMLPSSLVRRHVLIKLSCFIDVQHQMLTNCANCINCVVRIVHDSFVVNLS